MLGRLDFSDADIMRGSKAVNKYYAMYLDTARNITKKHTNLTVKAAAKTFNASFVSQTASLNVLLQEFSQHTRIQATQYPTISAAETSIANNIPHTDQHIIAVAALAPQ